MFTQNTEIRMASEDLRISPYDVKVRYEFINDSGHDIDAIVAFPLPDVDLEKLVETPIGRMSKDTKNFVHSKPPPTASRSRAVRAQSDAGGQGCVGQSARGRPRRGYLFGKLSQHARHAAYGQEKAAPEARSDEYRRDELVQPRWTVQTKYYWTQHFPAHKTVVIKHHYKPVTGQSFFDKFSLKAILEI